MVAAILSRLPFLVAIWVFLCGLYCIATSRNLIHLVICVAVLQTSTYLLLLGIGWQIGGAAPVFYDIPPGTPAVDPVVQALMLTDVVVEATVMALLLALAVLTHAATGTLDPDRLRATRG